MTVFLIGALFVALSAFLASIARHPDKGMLLGNIAFLYAFILGVAYNMLENQGLLKLIAPFNYFSSADLVAERLDPVYAAISLTLTAVFLFGAFSKFRNRDLA
jgi:thiamine transporter ThiT